MTPTSGERGERPRVVITGPTASGKGGVAHELALLMGSEIISMDSMKVYREMNIGTAKPPATRRAEVPYHLIDVVDPDVDFSVGDYLPRLEGALRDVHSRGVPAILSGGTPLYLKTYLDGFREGPAADWTLRVRLIEEARVLGPEALHQRLSGLDPGAAGKIHTRDLRRIVRALEVVEATGRCISEEWDWEERPSQRADLHVFALAWERAELYRRIDLRVEEMVARGLFDEALRLKDRRPPVSRSASQSIGYKEIWRGLAEGRAQSDIVAAVQQGTRRFAKRQLTWFRKLPVDWIVPSTDYTPKQCAEDILRRIENEPGTRPETER